MKLFGKIRTAARRYPLLVFAIILGAGMVSSSLVFAAKAKDATGGDFDPSRVLPQAISIPAATTVYTAETIKQFDGKNGHKCYVAVKGTVYEISGKAQWQNGRHLPSNNQAYCGADMTSAISKSPHGESKLMELPKVGVYKDK